MSDENRKIEKFIAENQSFLSARNIDIAHSCINGDWFVYCEHPRYHNYEYYLKFKTAKELVDILTQELHFEMYCCIGEEPAPPPCEGSSIAEIIASYHKSKTVSSLS